MKTLMGFWIKYVFYSNISKSINLVQNNFIHINPYNITCLTDKLL